MLDVSVGREKSQQFLQASVSEQKKSQQSQSFTSYPDIYILSH